MRGRFYGVSYPHSFLYMAQKHTKIYNFIDKNILFSYLRNFYRLEVIIYTSKVTVTIMIYVTLHVKCLQVKMY